jgi:hypothetical protein
MLTTSNPRTAWLFVAGIVALWQLVVLVLAGGGIFVDIYELFGIPWNSTGIINVVGTSLGFVILELPVLILAVFSSDDERNSMTWYNHTLQRTRHGVAVSNHCVPSIRAAVQRHLESSAVEPSISTVVPSAGSLALGR